VRRFPTIQEVMKATEDKLKLEQGATMIAGVESAVVVEQFERTDKPTTEHEYLEWLEVLAGRRPASPVETFTVAVVLGKALARGRVSIEHAARVCGLVRALRDGLSPCLVVFASSAASRAVESNSSLPLLDDAHAACTYFQHCCESVLGAAFPASRVMVSPTPLTTKEAMRKLLNGAISPLLKTPSEPVHVALFASEYQLRRFEHVWRVTPRLSLLAPLAARNDLPLKHKKKAAPEPPVGRPSGGPQEELAPKDRRYETTWSFRGTPYPPKLLADDAAGAFLAKTHVVVDSLVPLLVNLHGVVSREEFLAREYYDDLCDAKTRLARAQAVVDSPMRPAALRSLPTMATLSSADLSAHVNRPDAPPLVDEALERVIRWLNDLERLLRPAASRTDSLTAEDWRTALKLLHRALTEARLATDPDRPLPASLWGSLLEHAAPESAQRRHHKIPTNNGFAQHDQPHPPLDIDSDYFFFGPIDQPARYWSDY